MTVIPFPTHSIGGSESAAACGVHPYQSALELYLRKRGEWPEDERGEWLSWGNLLEPVIFDVLAASYDVEPAMGYEARDESGRPWMVGHPDGFVTLDGEPGILEIKTAGQNTAHDWRGASGAPLQYLMQLHHYFFLTGYDRALLACLVAGQHLIVRHVYRDERIVKQLLKGEDRFYGQLVSGEDPGPDGSTSAATALRGLFEGTAGKVV